MPVALAANVPTASTAMVIHTAVMPSPAALRRLRPISAAHAAATTGMPAGVNGISRNAIPAPRAAAVTGPDRALVEQQDGEEGREHRVQAQGLRVAEQRAAEHADQRAGDQAKNWGASHR